MVFIIDKLYKFIFVKRKKVERRRRRKTGTGNKENRTETDFRLSLKVFVTNQCYHCDMFGLKI